MITNLQLYLAIGLPIIAVLASLTVSLVQISGIREEMRTNMQMIREDIREIRSDIKILTGKVADIDTRLSVIEERWKIRP
ncbi:exported hypothetical protein [Candidatus Sulfopaludibacter sp. SbA4]|nr:exported hypothetical protein [Candidatus Sulfopaludibacter sp. SbA4]